MKWGRGWGHAATALTGGGLLLFGATTSNAQTAGAVPSGVAEINAVRTPKPPTIYGAIGDGEWAQAATAVSFIQYEPRRCDPSESRTEALVLYDAGTSTWHFERGMPSQST